MNTRPVSKEGFLRLSDEEVFKHAFPANFESIVGKRYDVKRETINTWTRGQRSVFMFIAVYYHNTHGWRNFVDAYSDAFRRGFMEDLKSGLKLLEDEALLSIVNRVEQVWASGSDTEPKMAQYGRLDEEYKRIKSTSLVNAAGYVRNHFEEFCCSKDRPIS